jgi:hypothetical protein
MFLISSGLEAISALLPGTRSGWLAESVSSSNVKLVDKRKFTYGIVVLYINIKKVY